MRAQEFLHAAADDGPPPRRLFLRVAGWAVGHKSDSTREFCYMMAPGQDYYHRLGDGEVYVFNSEERLCAACAERRGLLSYEPRVLNAAPSPTAVGAPEDADTFDVRGPKSGA